MTAKLIQKTKRFLAAEDGPTVVEYAVLLALLVGAMMASILYVGSEAQEYSNIVVTELDEHLNP